MIDASNSWVVYDYSYLDIMHAESFIFVLLLALKRRQCENVPYSVISSLIIGENGVFHDLIGG